MYTVLLTVVLAVHLMAANFATAGPFIGLWLEVRGRRRDEALATSLARQTMVASMWALAATIVLGFAVVGLMAWQWPAALARGFGSVPESRLWFGGVELAFYFLCLGLYLPLARTGPAHRSRARQTTLVILALLAGTDVAYHFPPLFAVVGIYSLRSESLPPESSFLAAMVEPEALALALHFMLASIAVGGVGLSWLALRTVDGAVKFTVVGGRIALASTLAQLLSGAWLVVATDDRMRSQLLGDDAVATILFGAGVGAAMVLMHKLASVALGSPTRRDVWDAAAWLALTITLMTGAQQVSRVPAYERAISTPSVSDGPLTLDYRIPGAYASGSVVEPGLHHAA